MKLIDDLFTFPIVMVDGENEERKEKDSQRFGTIPGQEDEVEYDIVYGEASYPYYNFIGFEDRWLPTQRSLRKALKQRFDACIVRFINVGQLLVPMNKETFRTRIVEFAEKREQPVPSSLTILKLHEIIEETKKDGEE